ncbi:feruloyl-CoA synthase [Sagittula salina]|uniref:Feruloyl-CoA synthase n=1 Tax=Sagittula salina TaxID=2820268 RepID=A0A940MMZ6_9RHOB|nr:feruloyl-CoA synthase [Sagittula salina]MBP0484870.1 feruloyl-CoA synthase [Sagittula salina]
MADTLTRERRAVPFWDPKLCVEHRADGSIVMTQAEPLGNYPRCLSDRFAEWAERTPDRPWIAEKGPDGWTRLTYGTARNQIRRVGQWLAMRGLGKDSPVLILSGNSIAHAVMALGAQHVGVPSAALAPAYALSGGDFLKLRDIAAQISPGVIFADRAEPFAAAIRAVFAPDIPVVTVEGAVEGFETVAFEDLVTTPPGPEEARASAAVTRETVAKFLFTSGTTGTPKAVIQTHGMLCSNQQMVLQCFTFLRDTPPVVVDWAPWNHTASGNKVFNMVLYNGGTYYIDDGRPTPQAIGKTIETLREISPTWYFNVPLGYQMLLDAFETDARLRDTFFRRIQMLFYAGAGMSQHVWDRITRVAEDMVPGGVLLTTGFGSTETGPFSIINTARQSMSGNLGLPAHGVTLKLVPQGEKLEARVKSPSITPGYWHNEALTREAFDEEGFYRFGDAFRLADPDDPAKGVLFDGRLAENFKLASGTWVAVGPLRAALTDAMGGMASDCVIAGEGQRELGALLVPNLSALRTLAGANLEGEALLTHPDVRHATAERLARAAQVATGSASRVTRALWLAAPLDFNRGEVTDKGSINQRAVLRHRVDLVDALWSGDPRVILAERSPP